MRATVLVRFALFSGVGATALVLWGAFAAPGLSVRLSTEADAVLADGEVVTAIRSSAGRSTLVATDLMEEPDMLPTWSELEEFYARQTILAGILEGDDLALRRADGTWRPVHLAGRSPGELPWVFYTQLFAALLAWMIGIVTYAYSDRDLGARMYLVSATGIGIVIWPACVYTTRALAIDGRLFEALSNLDHLGGYLYGTGTVGLFLTYPTKVARRLAPLWGIGVLAFGLELSQVLDKGVSDFYVMLCLYFLALPVAAAVQWRRSRPDPVARAAVGWMFLSVLLGLVVWVFLIMWPVVLGWEPIASQGVALTLYAVTYAGVSMGVLKLRLFDLDRWWFRAWTWLVSGALMIAVDLAITSLFHLGSRESLMITLAAFGWIYFPLRQWIWGRVARSEADAVGFDVDLLVKARERTELVRAMREILEAMFDPLRVEAADDPVDQVALDSMGTVLLVPSPLGGHLQCHYRNNGRDLFRRRDIVHAERLVALARSVDRALHAHDEGQEAERERIRRDLHDDMGASIIRIIHAAQDPEVASLAKRTMRDLRNVLIALAPESASVDQVLAEVRVDVASTAGDRAIEWRVDGQADWRLSSRQRANLVRTMREATVNALRHGDGTIELSFTLADDALVAEVANRVRPDTERGGLGLRNIAARVEEVGGELWTHEDGDRFRLGVRLPREEQK